MRFLPLLALSVLPLAAEEEPKWYPLFNGKDLAGWNHKNWKLDKSLAVSDGKGHLIRPGAFADYHCRIEAKSWQTIPVSASSSNRFGVIISALGTT